MFPSSIKQLMTDKKTSVNFGVGGGVFKGIADLLDAVGRLAEKGGEFRREGVYGVTIKTAIGGEPVVSTFGNIKRTPQGPTVSPEREPIVDIFDEKEEVRIIVEMPGVSQESIKTDIKGDILTLEAKDASRKYYKEIGLPKQVVPGTLSSKYKNGVLEIRISKT